MGETGESKDEEEEGGQAGIHGTDITEEKL